MVTNSKSSPGDRLYTYEVRSNRVVSDTNVSSVMRSENKDWVTLMDV